MNARIIISKTGQLHGFGTDKYKWVSRLTKEEREAVRNNETVLIKMRGKIAHNQTQYKKVIVAGRGFSHRNFYG